jgi:hypothetical protein
VLGGELLADRSEVLTRWFAHPMDATSDRLMRGCRRVSTVCQSPRLDC